MYATLHISMYMSPGGGGGGCPPTWGGGRGCGGRVLPYLGMVERFCGDEPRF